MEKKTFETPEVVVTVFQKEDILTLSTKESGDTPSVSW